MCMVCQSGPSVFMGVPALGLILARIRAWRADSPATNEADGTTTPA